jgi:hypothetical protein
VSDLQPGQIEIDGYRIGKRTDVIVATFEPGGLPSRTTNDRALAGADGRRLGKDVLDGRTISLGFTVDLEDVWEASRVYGELTRVWNSARTRGEDGAYVEMRVRRFALPTTVCYGRPRNFTPANEQLLDRGRVDVVAEFDTIDPYFYTDGEAIRSTTIPINPPETGGWAAPFPGPISVATTAEGFGEFVVEGFEPAPIVARVFGPITNPVLDLINGWKVQLLTSLDRDQYVDIDARPWVASVLRSDGMNLSGAFSSDTPPLSDLVLLPGPNELVLRGTDPTGTSRVTLSWQGAAMTPYWR